MIAKKRDIEFLRREQMARGRIISTAGVAVSRTVAGTSVRPLRKAKRSGGDPSGFVPKWG